MHLGSFSKMGANIEYLEDDIIRIKLSNKRGNNIRLDFPSVGVTENLMLLGGFCGDVVKLDNIAKEPEIQELANVLGKMGIVIRNDEGKRAVIYPQTKKLKPFEYTVMPDRIVTSTYMVASAITNGNIVLENVEPKNNQQEIDVLMNMGCHVLIYNKHIRIKGNDSLKAVPFLETLPYPGFPTDSQAQFLALMTVCEGESCIRENIFPKRINHALELKKMNQNIKVVEKNNATDIIVNGTRDLLCQNLQAKDLRGGAALVIASLRACGTSIVEGVSYIDRGYENLEGKLSSVGANIKRI